MWVCSVCVMWVYVCIMCGVWMCVGFLCVCVCIRSGNMLQNDKAVLNLSAFNSWLQFLQDFCLTSVPVCFGKISGVFLMF